MLVISQLYLFSFCKASKESWDFGLITYCNKLHTCLYFQAESKNATNDSILQVALDHGKSSGVIKPHDRVVVCQKVGDASVVKIIELED